MKWTYSIKNKLAASAVLLTLCLLVLLSYYLDRTHTERVKNSIVTLYEDRLIAEDYILKMTGNVYQIREVLSTQTDSLSKSISVNKQITDFNSWYNTYIKTKLTPTEKVVAVELLGYMRQVEQSALKNKYSTGNYTDSALVSLNKLSAVQLEESKLIMKNAESEYATIKTSSQFAFAVIIVILIVLQALVFSSKTLVPVNKPKDPTLN